MKSLLTLLIFLQFIFLVGCTGATPNMPGNLKNIKNIANGANIPRCLPANEMQAILLKHFNETLIFSGLMFINKTPPVRMLVLIYANKNKTFTITVTGKEKVSCVIIYGTDFEKESVFGVKI